MMKMRHIFTLLLLCHVCLHNMVNTRTVCSRPPPVEGSEVSGGQRVFEPGEQATLRCIQGYTPTGGSRKMTCTITGKWTDRSLKCTLKRCPTPDPPANGKVYFTSIVFQSTINYTCNEGYVLHGNNSCECLHTAIWSNPTPLCKPVKCGLPVIPKYAKIIYDKVFTGNTTEFGLGVTYKCLPPLALFGNERGYCTANRTWTDPPTCHGGFQYHQHSECNSPRLLSTHSGLQHSPTVISSCNDSARRHYQRSFQHKRTLQLPSTNHAVLSPRPAPHSFR
ncbi:beta-2-glycoprotein 1-like isoform X2 [Misgurnus anguillicaudatus]|uniref:beta-2-glycoprotein 1-like isoform X2 n=1 Tax=Misgurnus anguillicaudatus TaxID=75329 RepID=UPI003CCF6673